MTVGDRRRLGRIVSLLDDALSVLRKSRSRPRVGDIEAERRLRALRLRLASLRQ